MFGDRLKMVRKQNGLTQKSLASMLFVSQQSVWKWEKNESSPNPETIAKMAEIFGVSTDYLLGRDEAEKTPAPMEGDGLDDLDKKLLALIHDWSPKQKEYLFAHLQSLSGQER